MFEASQQSMQDEIVFNVKSSRPSSEFSEDGVSQSSKKSMKSVIFEKKRRKLSPEKEKELRNLYSIVIVNDYNDDYHLTDEEKRKRNKYYEVFSKLRKCKKKYQKLNEFIRVYRLALDCLDVVADDNGIYPNDKFISMVLKGKITVNGLMFPKYIGKDKKFINWDYVSEFIADRSRDPEELSKDNELQISDLSDEELEERLFTKEEMEKIVQSCMDEENTVLMSYDIDDEDEYHEDVAFYATKKERKKLVKQIPTLIRDVKEKIKADKAKSGHQRRFNSFVYDITNNDFDEIQRLNIKRGFEAQDDFPVFKGDILNRKDYMLFMAKLDEYEKEHVRVTYNGKQKSIGEVEEIETKNMLEKFGWNVRNLYHEREKEKKLNKAYKRDRKREEKLKKELMKVRKTREEKEKLGIVKKKKENKKNNDEEGD